jgi:hypothetical protein
VNDLIARSSSGPGAGSKKACRRQGGEGGAGAISIFRRDRHRRVHGGTEDHLPRAQIASANIRIAIVQHIPRFFSGMFAQADEYADGAERQEANPGTFWTGRG